MKKFTFTATLQKHPNLDAAYVEIPFDAEKAFGKKRIPVRAVIDGAPYRGTLVRMGLPCWWLGVTQEIRKKIRKDPGDRVEVILEEDPAERTVDIPEDLQKALDTHLVAANRFASLSYTNRKEYARWVEEAKKEETRKARVERTISMLEQGKRNPGEK